MRNAFSLVELSIVLVILGLLTGGILAGQSLIRASELRKATRALQSYSTAVYAFRDKYFQIPGDITNATSFWGDQATGGGACANGSTPDGTPGTCNGNGNGLITLVGGSASNGGETTRFWQHLAMAGLIEGSYSGITNAAEPWISGGTNMPPLLRAPIGVNPYSWGLTYNVFELGSPQITAGAYVNTNAMHGEALRPEDAWNIDTKLDDGLPSAGKYTSFNANSLTCLSGSAYALSTTTVTCASFYRGMD